MDPNEALRVVREAARRLLDEYDAEAAYELAERFVALDEWLTRGGFLPAVWWPTPPAA